MGSLDHQIEAMAGHLPPQGQRGTRRNGKGGAMSSSSFQLLAAIVAFSLGAVTADAAEIRAGPSRATGLRAVLEGQIEPGDFDRLRSFVFEKGWGRAESGVSEIYLASPGGDLAEAMKIGRLVRELKLTTVVPASSDLREKAAARHNLKDAKANYMCASACFFVFVAGIHRKSDVFEPLLGMHRPYLSENDLRALSSDKAIAAATRTRAFVESYLKEMGVPTKYADQMFSVPRDGIRWLSKDEFDADFEGFIPELKDWVDARCDKRTDFEKSVSESIKNKFFNQLTAAEKIVTEALIKKNEEQNECEIEIRYELALRAYGDVRYPPKFTYRPAPETWTSVK
jgi:hypothetical protein